MSTLELFVGSTMMFDNGVQGVLFGEGGNSPHNIELIVLTTVYVAAIITTSYLIGMFVLRRLSSHRWLKRQKKSVKDEVFIFFGVNVFARNLIRDLRERHADALILAVDYITDKEKAMDVSLPERIRDVFTNKRDGKPEGATILLKAKRSVADADPADLCGSFGLRHLQPYLDCCKAKIYLLLENQEDNLSALNNLLEAKVSCSRIYCHVRRDELNSEIEETFRNIHLNVGSEEKCVIPEVTFIDSSFLAVRSMLRPCNNDFSLLPVNYVRIASDKKGQNSGYVESGFKAMILGFGETGQEALSFLYEHGAFVGKDKNKAPFECHVYDNNMSSILGCYSVSHPGMNQAEAGICFHNAEIGSEDFWKSFETNLTDTNYIVVCAGSDQNNLSIIKNIILHLGHKDTVDMFRIMVKQSNPDGVMRKTLAFMSAKEHNCIQPFGMVEDIWREDVVSDDRLTEMAKEFRFNYALANNKDGRAPEEIYSEWDKRDEIICAVDTPREIRLNEMRKRAQDYANCLHFPTKIMLMKGPLLDNAKNVAEAIPGVFDGELFAGDESVAQIIEYMAIGEHLRWEASHVAMGYKRGKEGESTDAEKMVHEYIRDFTKLAPAIQHYDWLVIRTTLELYANHLESV